MTRARTVYPIVYVTEDGTEIEYVGRTKAELPDELTRIRHHLNQALRLLRPLRRLRNGVLRDAEFSLLECVSDLGGSEEYQAREIARLSYVMECAEGLLARLVNARAHNLDRIRFLLTYGRSPHKRNNETILKKVEDEEDGEDSSEE